MLRLLEMLNEILEDNEKVLIFTQYVETGKIYAERRRSGITTDPEDAMIAGICKFKKEPVLTRKK